MSNLSIYVRLGADVLVEQEKFYGYHAGWGFQILMTLSTLLIGFCLAGLFRSIVVIPRELIWPGVLGVTALTTTLHNVSRGETRFVHKLLFQFLIAQSVTASIPGNYPDMPSFRSFVPALSVGTGFPTSSSRH
jgi:hypothetical protein